MRELHAAAPAPVDVVALPAGAPFGTVEVNVEGCTLCLSCVSACPTGALSDDPERPMLRFAEDACVQCGLCKATCPEKVISLKPQLDFRAATAMSRVLKQEEPFACIRCGKPFGVKSTIERVAAKLEGKHWMFKDSKKRLDVIKMCETAASTAMATENFDPFGAPPRPPVRTTEDYLRERESAARAKANAFRTRAVDPDNASAHGFRFAERVGMRYFFVAFSRNSTSALRSSAEPIVCSGILVPGV